MDYKDENTWLMFGDCLERMKEIPDGSVDCVIADPPYVGMVNEKWDHLSNEQANIFYSGIFNLIASKLRYGGRFILFGSNDTLEYYYKHNNLRHRELLVVTKDVKRVSAGRNTSKYKQHVNCTEYIFVGTKYSREYTRDMLLRAKEQSNLSAKSINEQLGVKSTGGGMWSIYTGNNKCNQVPTREQWNKFMRIFDTLPEYSSFEEVFHNDLSKGNVLDGYSFNFKDRVHPTQKPVALMEYLIKTYTNEGETVLDFTAGSMSTAIACINTNRKGIMIEKDEHYFKVGSYRVAQALLERGNDSI